MVVLDDAPGPVVAVVDGVDVFGPGVVVLGVPRGLVVLVVEGLVPGRPPSPVDGPGPPAGSDRVGGGGGAFQFLAGLLGGERLGVPIGDVGADATDALPG